MEDLDYQIICKCNGSLTFKVNSVSFDKQYNCPNCGVDLGAEVLHVLVNVKESLKHHCESCQPLNNVKYVYLNGRLL